MVGSCGGRSIQVQTFQSSRSPVSWTQFHCVGVGLNRVHVEQNDDNADCDRTLRVHRSDPVGSP